MAVLGGFLLLARPAAPAPLPAAAAWSARASGPLTALAGDVADALQSPPAAPLDGASAHRLAGDLARFERAGPPPDRAAASIWSAATRQLAAAVATASRDPAAARHELQLASLELVGLVSGS
ncbi:MAG TPA: hypothetical protein VKI19_14050 [Acidimicrobiales bacterium]|nr:hypothetical protein [Acidimicrobiales bacterium]